MEDCRAPIYFCIPLRGRSSSISWQKVCLILEATLTSVSRQTENRYEVLIACHEIPTLEKDFAFPISFLQTKREKPADRTAQLFDKRHKKMLLAEEVCRRGGGYMVMLDSDDLVSNRLASHILENHNERGFSINVGYTLDVGKRSLRQTSNFAQVCGSCAIFYLKSSDLAGGDSGWAFQIGDAMHRDFAVMAAEMGRPLEPICFPAIIYMQNHGENHTSLGQGAGLVKSLKERVQSMMNSLLPDRRIPDSVRQEFGLNLGVY